MIGVLVIGAIGRSALSRTKKSCVSFSLVPACASPAQSHVMTQLTSRGWFQASFRVERGMVSDVMLCMCHGNKFANLLDLSYIACYVSFFGPPSGDRYHSIRL